MEISSIYRTQQRSQAIFDRGGAGCLCDRCGINPATDYHEIIHRNKTVSNSSAQMASFNKYICALLCQACHISGDNNAHSEAVSIELLKKNIQRYDYDSVRGAFDTVNVMLRYPLTIPFPEKETA